VGDNTGAFPTTDWSLLSRARHEAPVGSRGPLADLLQRYLPAVRRYLLRVKRLGPNETDEVVQAFVAKKLLEGALLQSADRRRGRFRNLLVRALENFLSDTRRSERSAERLQAKADSESVLRNIVGETFVGAFEAEWARSVVAEAVARTFHYCERRRRDDLWQVLRCRVVDPAADGAPAPSYKELVERFGYATPAQAANALLAAKRIFIRKLNEVLLEQAGEGADAAEELNDLREILARRAKTQSPRRK
jgi:hypothetical protein